MLAERSGLAPCAFPGAESLPTFVGEVAGLDAVELPAPLHAFDCRNQRLAELALLQDHFLAAVARLRERHGAARVGVFLGTSTSGLLQTELAYARRDTTGELPQDYLYRGTQNTGSLAAYVRARCGLEGPAHVISTACSSSAKVFASAWRAMRAGFCDAALVGGVDTLCRTTLFGFGSLQLLSNDVCRPADAERRGLSIGEGGGFALVQWADAVDDPAHCARVLGIGESSDAHHMSSPSPDGAGASAAMRGALARAGLAGVDYVNLHGTATPANDLVEDRALVDVFGQGQACSSSKGWTGHTLGAAGIVEAVLGTLCLREGLMPRSLNTRTLDPRLASRVLLASERRPLKHLLSNSFGFGGSNCSLVLEAAPAWLERSGDGSRDGGRAA